MALTKEKDMHIGLTEEDRKAMYSMLERLSGMPKSDLWKLEGAWNEIYKYGQTMPVYDDERIIYDHKEDREDREGNGVEEELPVAAIVSNISIRPITDPDDRKAISFIVRCYDPENARDVALYKNTVNLLLLSLKNFIRGLAEEYRKSIDRANDPEALREFVQEAVAVILQWLPEYNPEYSFTTYVTSLLKKTKNLIVQSELQADSSRHYYEEGAVIRRCIEELEKMGVTNPTPQQISDYAGYHFKKQQLSAKRVVKYMEQHRTRVDVEALEDVAGKADEFYGPEQQFLKKEQKERMAEAIGRLAPIQKAIVLWELQYFDAITDENLKKAKDRKMSEMVPIPKLTQYLNDNVRRAKRFTPAEVAKYQEIAHRKMRDLYRTFNPAKRQGALVYYGCVAPQAEMLQDMEMDQVSIDENFDAVFDGTDEF